MRNTSSLVIRVAICIGLITLIVSWAGGLGAIGALLVRIDPVYVVLVLALYTADRALMTYKWVRLLSSRGQALPFFRAMKLYTASMVWGMFLPTTLGADAVRVAGARRLGLDVDHVLGSITIERMIGFLSALLLGLIGIVQISNVDLLGDRYDLVWKVGAATLILALFFFAATFSSALYLFVHDRLLGRWQGNPFVTRLRRFHRAYLGYQDVKGELLVFFGLTMVEQTLPVLECGWLAWGMDIDVGLLRISGAVIVTLLISRIPISIDGLGVFEGAFVLLLAAVGIGATEAVAIAFAGRVLQTISWLPWWVAQVIETGSRSESVIPRRGSEVGSENPFAHAIAQRPFVTPEIRVAFYQQDDDLRYGAERDTQGEDVRVRELVQQLGDPLVLEFGCGLHNLREQHLKWIGLDVSAYALRRLRHGRRICADWGAGLPLRDGSVPFVVSIFTLEHIPDPEKALEELDRVLAPGGSAYLKPAFNVPPWRANGLEYLDPTTLDRWRRWQQRTLVVRRHPMWRFVTRLLWTRLADELRLARALRRGRALDLRWRPLIPYHGGFIGPDSDAVAMLDKAALAVWFRSRNYTIAESCGAATVRERLLAKHTALVVRKQESA